MLKYKKGHHASIPPQVTSAILTLPDFLPSATKLRRLCFYTCTSVHGGLPQCILGYQTPPHHWSRHPLLEQALHPPGAGTPLWDQTPRSRHPPGPDPLGAGTPPGTRPPPPQTATVADITHPTGMLLVDI